MTDFARVKWDLPEKEELSHSSLAELVLERRGYDSQEAHTILNPRYDSLGDPFGLLDMDLAVQTILDARGSAPIIIYGDYDIDGLTASTLLGDVCTSLGIAHEIYIPDRFEEGYGIHVEALRALKQQGAEVVVSVDCGSSATEAALEAGRLGLKLVITDHHTLVSDTLEGSVAHINPLREKNTYPERNLAGVGVAFALARALQKASDYKLAAGQEKWLLDLAALGTVCDVVPLKGENRTLAAFGLAVMRKSRRFGIQALAAVAGVDLREVRAEDLGYKFGPRLNAAGRLEHARYALNLLTASTQSAAKESAEYLQALNTQRQADTKKIQAAARQQALERLDDRVLVLSDVSWSHGIVGLVASRISEEFCRPAILLQRTGKVAKGSARSFAGISIIDALQRHSGILEKFGGHKAAAGMTLRVEAIPALREGLDAYIAQLDDTVWTREEKVDAWLQPVFTSLEGYAELERLEPTGQGHPGVRFVLDAKVSSLRPVGSGQAHYQMLLKDEAADGHEYKVIAFGAAERWPELAIGDAIRAIVRLSKSVWQGMSRVEVVLLDILEKDKISTGNGINE